MDPSACLSDCVPSCLPTGAAWPKPFKSTRLAKGLSDPVSQTVTHS